MNWLIYVALILGWLFAVVLILSLFQTFIGSTTEYVDPRRSLLPEAVAIFSVTVLFLGLLVTLP